MKEVIFKIFYSSRRLRWVSSHITVYPFPDVRQNLIASCGELSNLDGQNIVPFLSSSCFYYDVPALFPRCHDQYKLDILACSVTYQIFICSIGYRTDIGLIKGDEELDIRRKLEYLVLELSNVI